MNDIKYYIFNYENIFDLKAYITFYKLFKKIDIDIVHTQLYPAHFYGRVSGFCSNVPLIVSTYRNSPLWIKSKNIKSRLKNGLDKFSAKYFTNALIGVSEGVKRYCEDEGFNVNNFYTIYNSVDIGDKPSKLIVI